MSVSRANLIGGPGKVTWNGMTLFAREEVGASFEATWQDLVASHQGIIDKVVTDRQIRIPLRLWGEWENAGGTGDITKLFPSAVLNPVVGTRIYGTSDLPLTMVKKTGSAEIITVHNVQLTRLANLYLGVDSNIYAADLEFTGLIKNSGNPEDANAYYTIATTTYSDTTFEKTYFNQQRWGAVWGASPFDAFQFHKGLNIEWEMGLEDEYNANVGTVDKILTSFMGRARGIPLGPTIAQIEARMNYQGSGNPLGSLLSDGDDDLVLTGAAPSSVITLKGAAITNWRPVMGATPLLNGEVTWETTRGFSSGTGAAIATVV